MNEELNNHLENNDDEPFDHLNDENKPEDFVPNKQMPESQPNDKTPKTNYKRVKEITSSEKKEKTKKLKNLSDSDSEVESMSENDEMFNEKDLNKVKNDNKQALLPDNPHDISIDSAAVYLEQQLKDIH